MASMPSTLQWQHSVGNMVSNFFQPIEGKLSQWFWQGINTLPQSYFSEDITKLNYFDKSLWQGIFNDRLESLKEQLVSELIEQESLPVQNTVVLAKIDKLKEQKVADVPQNKFLVEKQLIYLQGIVGKYMLSPQFYEKGLDHLKQVVSNNEQYIITIEQARSVFRSELKKQPALLAECLQGDVLCLFQESSQNSLTPTPLKNILSYYKPLMAHKSYVRHQNWLQECYNTQSLLPPPAIKRHATTDAPSDERKEENVTWSRSISNLGKLLWEHVGKLITLGLATQVTVAQALGTNVTHQNSRLIERDTLERVNPIFTNNTTLDFKILPTPIESWSSTLVNKSAQDTIIFENKDDTNNTEIFKSPFNISTDSEFDQYIEIKQELKQEILNQFDKINDDLHALIEIFSADKNKKILEAKSNQTMLSRVIRSSFPFSQRQECTVSQDKLVELKNTIQDTLSNVNTPRESNCELNTLNTDGCDELIKLIQCGVNNLKNGFIQATQNTISLESYTKLDNLYNDLQEQFKKISDKIKQQVSQEYQQLLNTLNTDLQVLSRSLNRIKVELMQEIKDNCISEIGNGHIETAVSKFKKLNGFGNGHLLHDIIDKAYTNYGQLNNFDNIINFIAKLPWFSDWVIGYEALYDKMEKNTPKILIFVRQVQLTMGDQYMLKNEPTFVPRLNSLKTKAMISVNNIIDAWSYKIRNNDYQQIMEFAKKYSDTINSNLDQLIEKAYASDLGNAETIIKFIRDLPGIGNDAVASSSLFKQMQRNSHLDNYQLLMLAYSVKQDMEMPNYPNISQENKDKFITLKNDLPSSVRGLIWNGNNCIIRSVAYNYEYLYPVYDKGGHDSERRYVFTWKKHTETPTREGYWKIEPVSNGNFFIIRSVAYNSEYLYPVYNNGGYDSERRYVFTWKKHSETPTREGYWKIEPVSNGNFFIIRSVAYNYEYLYPVYDNGGHDSERRYVFTWKKHTETPTREGYWKMDYVKIPVWGQLNTLLPRPSLNELVYSKYGRSVFTWRTPEEAPTKEVTIMYQLTFSNQAGLLPHPYQEHVQSIYSIRSSTGDIIACIRSKRDLIGYKYVESTGTWQQYWSERVFNKQGDYSAALYPWLISANLLPNADIIVLKHPDGIRFYEIDSTKPGLKLLKEDGHFHDVYSYTLLLGSFYSNEDYIGVMTRDPRRTLKFYAATSDSFLPNTSYPLFPFDNKLSLTSAWLANDTDFFVTKLLHNNIEAIGLRSSKGLEFYQFNADYLLGHIISTQQITKSHNSIEDRIFFADLTHQIYQDILHLNDSGLFVYQYNNKQQDYTFLHHNTEFTQSHGWSPHYSDSLRLIDINSDSRDDLLFTGPQGITVLSFDSTFNNWHNLLSSEQLSGLQRYATVIGSLPAMPPIILQPSIFIQDTKGEVHWAKIAQAPPVTSTIMAPTGTTHKTPTIQFSNQIPKNKDISVPDQILRANLPEKPILHWAEQWGDSFLKEAVDSASGQVRLNIPLIDISSLTNWALQVTLSYNSQASTSDLLGVGWSLPLAQDYIIVDYQGSIIPEDARYYLMIQGRPQLLNLAANERGVQRFQLAEADKEESAVTIEYHKSEQYWLIEGTAEQTIYGKANNTIAKDALRWSLAWSTWRGPGRDKTQQQPLITAWYLNKRFDKNNQLALYYYYEIDNSNIKGGKAYSSALRLKSIGDKQQMQLTLDYAPKSRSEYTVPNPIDDKGNIIFPIPFAQSHYLQGYSITTSAYSQVLKFSYHDNNGKRLLTAITQQLLSHSDPILQFSYQRLLEKQVLTSCKLLPRGSTVNFHYDSITPPITIIAHDNILSYPIREKAKIAYGPDYTVMAYRDLNPVADKVILRIMNREMTQTVTDYVVDPAARSAIKSYSVQAYSNSFVVFIEIDQKKGLYIFNRHNKQTWSTAPTIYSFGNKVLVRFSETVIAAAEPDENNIMLYERGDNQSGWNEKTLFIPRAMTFLALHKRLVVGYDDNQLWLLYHDSQSVWQRKALGSNLVGLASMNRKTLASFDLTSEILQQLSTALEQNGLQILNNFILLSALQENSGQLFSHVHLFLLDAQLNIIKKQEFKIKRENIYKITRESKSQDEKTIYHLGYIQEGGVFKVRVKSIASQTIEDIRNSNRRQDAIEEQTKHLNQDPEFQKSAKEYFFLDWNLYPIQINQYGAYCGNDILLRITGTGWEQESLLHKVQTIRLGQSFILEADNDNKSLLKLYKQDNNKNKLGRAIKELQLHSPDQLINRYPAYIAYHSEPNLVKVLTFHDDKTLGQLHTFSNEQLLPESDWQNLVTIANASASTMVHAEPQECKVRPISTLINSKPQLFISQMMLTDGNIQRLTGYQHSFNNHQHELTYSEKVTMIPGDNKNLWGWYEAIRFFHVNSGNITETEHWFNANGQEVLMPPKEQSDKQDINTANEDSESKKGLLLDRSGKWLISDVSPYKLADEMIAYYGFESYENNQIGTSYSNSVTKTWNLNKAKIIKGKFSFTGENYLQLSRSATESQSFLEGVLQPHDQETTYLAACWLRCSTPLTLHKPAQYLKAIISTTDGAEITDLLAQTKHQIGDWFYLELPINFQVMKQIYKDYVDYNEDSKTTTILSSPNNAQFKITLRVEAPYDQTVDLDHIRFSPLTHDFQATIYHPLTGKSTALIQTNGLVIRNIYNRLQQEIASTDEEGHLKQFSSTSKTGKLVPLPQGSIIDAKPNMLTFEPENGFYETFDSYALRDRWKVDNPHAWNIAPSQLWHTQLGRHQIKARKHLFNSTSAAIRCYFALQQPQSSLSFNWQEIGKLEFMRQSDDLASLILPNGHTIAPLQSAGELIVMLEEHYIWLWLDGVLLLDQELSRIKTNEFTPWSSFTMQLQNQVLLEDMLVMNRPQIKVQYYNAFGEKTQVIQLEDAKTSLVTETLYDELGREAITTKTTRVYRTADQPLLAYHQDFVTNKDYSNIQSVWRTGKLQGKIDQLNTADQGVAYTRTEYTPNPLNEAAVIGLPSPEFSITGPYRTKISRNSDIAFLDNLFPISHGYSENVEHTPNGSRKVTVFDKHHNQVARYVRVPSFNHLLSTYEYDTENRLIKILPPLYHEKVHTAKKSTMWQPGEDHLSIQEKQWQQAIATYFIYDKYGHLIRKITPDSGVTEYLYNTAGQVRFMVSVDSTNQPQRIIYFNYDINGQLSSTGYFNQLLSITILQQYLERPNLPNVREYQQFDYADDQLNPLLRGRVKYCITHNQGEPIIEKLQFNAQQQIVTKSTITLSGQADVQAEYVNNKINMLTFPITVDGKPLSIVHSYNRLGQLVALGTNEQPSYYASFSYHATGQLASEQYQAGTQHGFIRRYRYNSPGFLNQISDPFLTEEITYTEKGYGHAGYGDGLIMQTAFNASWPVNADGRWFQLQERELVSNHSAICMKALKRTGYLTAHNKPVKLYIRDIETTLPLVCGGETGRNIAKLIAEKQTPNYYGHSYAYGNHQELVKAKYFTDDSQAFVAPFQSDSFAKRIPHLTNKQSEHIWQLLVNTGYIITDQQRTDSANTIGKRGKSFLRSTDLHKDLLALNSNYVLYAHPIERLIVAAISKQQIISLTDFETVFFQWQGIDQVSSILVKNQQKAIAKQIGQMLLDKGYLPTQTTGFTAALGKHFTDTLHQYATFIPHIVQVVSQHFAYGLGEATFDVESYNIDANGNHHLFYTGFIRYELAYRNTTNQIKNIKSVFPTGPATETEAEQTFAMQHDAQGNVIQALHKDIQSIKYHTVSQRSTHIHLTDGRTLRFYYDAQGERIIKRVFNAEGKINHETHYLRDEQGRVLVDRQTKFLPETTQQIVTAYLYGPRGLLGFFRNNNFYSVTTDHAGSVRLVTKEGKVVAAYDYLPYGQLMRSYSNDPQAHIMYRYTGQEWDEETGLYNYHARLYDPSIGRFYQPDPKAQYYSPYNYADNSPISTIDPDGELAFLLASLALGVVGAYLGGAAVNNRWNPVVWDFKDSGTWLGIGGGALVGSLLPLGSGASVAAIGGLTGSTAVGVGATIGLGSGGAYLTTAAANQNWNPIQWKWDRPHTWSGVFQGFGAGSGIAGGIGLAHNFANTGKALTAFSKAIGVSRDLTKVMFLSVSYTAGGGMAYGAGALTNNGNFAFWQWDWESPTTWSSLVDGFDTGMGWPQNFIEISRGLSKLSKHSHKSYSLLGNPSKINRLKTILKNPKHPLYKVTTSIVMAYFMGSSGNGELDITRWSLASFSTYEGVLNGIFFGKDTSLQSTNSLPPTYTNRVKHWASKFVHMLDIMLDFRTKIESKRLIEQLFSSDKVRHAKLQQLRNVPDALIRDIENFFKGGLEKWKKGDIEPPEVLKHLISQEAEQKVRSSTQTQKLVEWRTEEGELSRKQQEVFPDRDVEFLNCHSIARRRKRGDDTLSCVPSTSTAVTAIPENQSNKPKDELIKQFFDSTDPGISRGIYQKECGCISIRPRTSKDNKVKINEPQGFAEHLSVILRNTPTILGPSKPEFWPNFILGSIYTIPQLSNIKKDIYTKVVDIDVYTPTGHNIVKHKILKICFKQNDQTLLLKTFIAEEHKINSIKSNTEDDMRNFQKRLMSESRYSQSELDAMSTKLGIKDNYQIEENIFYVTPDHSLFIKELSTTKDKYQYKDTSFGEFHKIENTNIDLKHLEDLASNNIDNVMFGIKAISQGLLQVYNSLKIQDTSKKGKSKFEKKNKYGFDIKSEAAFQGFFYGVLSLNFKYHYYLDIYVERIAGKGYADLILLSRKDNSHNKNWRAIPIVIEFKADDTSSASAIDQAKGTGYLYNLSMRTIADQAVIVGINSKIDSDDVNKAINIERENIPQPEGLINPLIRNINDNTKTQEDIRNNIENELKHVYYSISNLAIKTDDNYLSRLILGEFLSRDGVEKLYVHKSRNTVSSFVFQEKSSKRWIMLNLVESSDNKKFQDVNLDKIEFPDKVHINSLTKIDIKVNHNSKLGWSPEQKIRTDDKTKGKDDEKLYFFQNIEVFDQYDVSNFKKISNYKKLTSISIENFFSRGNIDTELEQLSQSLISIQDMVNSESDFQAILHGMFFGKHDQHKTIKVLPEANPSKSGRIDLLICRREDMGSDVPQDEHILIMELKYANNKKDSNNKLNEANKQILKYISNLKSITDSHAIIPITLVFNKEANIAQDIIKYEVHANKLISHTSNTLSDSQTLQELADYLQKSSDDISRSQLDNQTFAKIQNTVNELAEIMSQPGDKTFFDKINKILREIAISDLDPNDQNSANFANKKKIDYLKKRLNDLLELVKNTQQFDPMSVDNFRAIKDLVVDYSDLDNEPSTKKQKIHNRRKRSLNYTKEYQNISSTNISNRRTLIEDEYHIVLNQEATLDTESSYFNVASSGVSSRLQFWPINLLKNVGIIISSILPVSWISGMMNYNEKSRPAESLSLLQPDLPVKQQSSLNQCETVPTLLQMGDQWLNNTDMNGLLTLGIFLARKWTGYKPQSSEVLSDNRAISIKLDIQSATLVDEFQSVVLKHARSCGIRSCISDIFEDGALYCKTIQVVRKNLAIGELAAIPQLLYQQLVQNNIKKVASKSTQVQANKLLAGVAADIPNLQQQFLECEQEWLSYREHAVKTMASQACNNIKPANVCIPDQAISSMQQSEHIAQQFPVVMTTQKLLQIFNEKKKLRRPRFTNTYKDFDLYGRDNGREYSKPHYSSLDRYRSPSVTRRTSFTSYIPEHNPAPSSSRKYRPYACSASVLNDVNVSTKPDSFLSEYSGTASEFNKSFVSNDFHVQKQNRKTQYNCQKFICWI